MGGMLFKIYHESVGEVTLEHAPVGWDGLRYKFLRDQIYHGMTREFTVELEFVKDGFEYIHTLYEAYGIRANVLIFVYEENPHNFRFELAYQGILALEKWRVLDGEGAKGKRGIANIDFMGFTQRFVNGEDIEVNINSLNGIFGQAMPLHPTVPVVLHSQAIQQSFHGVNTISVQQGVGLFFDGGDEKYHLLFGFDDVKKNDFKVFDYQSGIVSTVEPPELFTASGNGSHQIDIKMKGKVVVILPDAGALQRDDFDAVLFRIYLQKNDEPPIELHNGDDLDAVSDYIGYYQINKSVKMELVAGDKVAFYGTLEIALTEGNNWQFPIEMQMDRGSELKIEATTSSPDYEAKGTLIYEALSTICTSITGYPRAFYSDFFGRTDSFPIQYPVDGIGSMLLLLNGFKLRGLDYEAVVKKYEIANGLRKFFGQEPLPIPPNDGKYDIFVSFKELFLALDAIFCLGCGVEVVNGEMMVRIEPRRFFYNNDIVLDLGRVSALEKMVDLESYHNEAEFGYTEWKIESDNGLLEFNTKHSYTIPNEKIKSKYSAISKIIAAGYRIEKVKRQRLLASEDADTADDDKNFFICMRRDEGKWISDKGGYTAEGISNVDTAFNLRINPTAMRDNHLSVVRLAFYKHPEDAALRFNKGEGAFTYKLTDMDGVMEGGKDVLHKDMPLPYSVPEIYKFKYELNHFQLRTLRENPYGIIRFRDQHGNVLMGHLKEVDASAKGLSEFTLKRAYDA